MRWLQRQRGGAAPIRPHSVRRRRLIGSITNLLHPNAKALFLFATDPCGQRVGRSDRLFRAIVTPPLARWHTYGTHRRGILLNGCGLEG
jgi:hypothetical protein